MDLGIAGRVAIVCASSKGLGRGCAMALAEAGVTVVINGRNTELLQRTADAIIAATGTTVIAVPGDVTSDAGRAALLAAAPAPDILVNNNGGPPLGDFAALDRAAIQRGLDANLIAPVLLLQAVLPGMVERGFGRIVNITSSSVKMPLTGLDLSSGARAGLTGFVAGVARGAAYANVTINNLLPGAFDTDRIASMMRTTLATKGTPIDEQMAARTQSIPARRLGDPAEFGAACAFLCSAQAGYITGQSLLIDGGSFPGLM